MARLSLTGDVLLAGNAAAAGGGQVVGGEANITRVPEQTTIEAILKANGQVFVVNPSEVVFGKGAQVDVGALTATTLGISNEAFMRGGSNLSLTSAGNTVPGFVKVEAGVQITAKSFVALLSEHTVSSAGTIAAGTDANAKDRSIAMMAGTNAATIHLGSFDVTVDQAIPHMLETQADRLLQY